MSASRLYVSSYEELAIELGAVSDRTLKKYAKLPGWPTKTAQGFDVLAVMEWMKARGLPKEAPSASEGLNAKKGEKLDEEIALLRIKRAKAEQQVVPIDAINQGVMRTLLSAKQVLYQALEQELPPLVAGQDSAKVRLLCREAADRVCAALEHLDTNIKTIASVDEEAAAE